MLFSSIMQGPARIKSDSTSLAPPCTSSPPSHPPSSSSTPSPSPCGIVSSARRKTASSSPSHGRRPSGSHSCLLVTSRVVALLSSPPRNPQKLDLSRLRELSGVDLCIFNIRVKIAIQRFKLAGTVIRLSKDTIAKRGGPNDVRLTDARTLQFIAETTSIPVPPVYDIFSARGETWLVMEYIDAPLLCDVWRHLSEEDQLNSMHQLKGYIDQLRSLEPPEPGKVQAVDGGTCIESRLAAKPWGPFNSITDFQRFYGYHYVYKNCPQYRADFEKVAGRVYRTVFTHGDLGPHNVLWKDGRIVGVIDWETAGWLPEYWEYVMCYFGPGSDLPMWWEMFDRVMDSYPDELIVEADVCSISIRA